MALGDAFKEALGRARWAPLVGIAIVAADLLLWVWVHDRPSYEVLRSLRIPIAALAIVALLTLARGDHESLGLVWRPRQGWHYWIRATLLIGLAALALIGIVFFTARALGRPFDVPTLPWQKDRVLLFLTRAGLEAHIREEIVYRMALCAPLLALIGRWPTIVASGVLFGWVHVLSGNPGPDNLIGGFFLAWAFIHSESLVVPVLLHALGNVCVQVVQLLCGVLL